MMQIVVVGGGISGLSVLHYLNKRYSERPEVQIQLLEKAAHLGGCIQTETFGSWTFEKGPNGFLDNKIAIRELCGDLNLEGELIENHPQASQRYVYFRGKLHAFPPSFFKLLFFQPLSLLDKIRIPFEMLVPRGTYPDESVFEFGERRFGQNLAEVLLDPMVSGIYAGDVKKLNFKEAFPALYELEQKFGSLLWGLIKSKKMNEPGRVRRKSKTYGPKLLSFKKGMVELIETLQVKYTKQIKNSVEVLRIERKDEKFRLQTKTGQILADEVFLCTPAAAAAELIRPTNPNLAQPLAKIQYAPLAVVGLVYQKKDLTKKLPTGLGYLVPSSEQRDVLGILFESQIFPERCDFDHVLFRMMLGGVHHPGAVFRPTEEILQTAKMELQEVLSIQAEPRHHFIAVWPQAIPQYNTDYVPVRMTIERELYQMKGLHITANYLRGVSINDCVLNAQIVAQQSKF